MSSFTFTLSSECVNIINDALAQVGREEATASGLDATSQTDLERICDRQFHPNLKYVIHEQSWKKVEKRAQLTATSMDSAAGWLYKYTLPSDFHRLNYAYPTGLYHDQNNPLQHLGDYRIEGSNLLTNIPVSLNIGYNYYPLTTGYDTDADVTTAWDGYIQALHPALREAVVAFFAYKFAYPLKRDMSLKESLWINYKNIALPEAIINEESMISTEYIPDGPMVLARMGW